MNNEIIIEGNVPRGGMKVGQIYTQKIENSDLFFKPTDTTNNGVKGILYTVYHGKKIAGKNPKKDSVVNIDMDLWSTADNVSSDIKRKLEENYLKEQKQSVLQKKYAEFFRSKMEEFGVKSPVELKTTEERKRFWNSIKDEWPEAKKKIKEGHFRQTIRNIIAEELLSINLSEILAHNANVQNYLKRNGITASVKRIDDGSLKGRWRIYGKGQPWTRELIDKLTKLGFKDMDGKPLNRYSGNGGMFSIFARFDDSKIK